MITSLLTHQSITIYNQIKVPRKEERKKKDYPSYQTKENICIIILHSHENYKYRPMEDERDGVIWGPSGKLLHDEMGEGSFARAYIKEKGNPQG